ncbi:MAG: hypothetical protein DMF61_18235 [Blastocatellia bacterium AA13]|nr:MAG: hypothetical protein DMF61_18235 [Blastocatellia bacterium AA13]
MTSDERIRAALQKYADRGVFRGFSETRSRNGKLAFTFLWQTPRQLEFVADIDNQTLMFRNLLPNILAGSPMHSELRKFVEGLHDRQVPKHRRIERARAEVTCATRGGNLSVSLKVKNNQYTYGVNRLVNLTHELFVHLNDCYSEYLSEQFDMPQE